MGPSPLAEEAPVAFGEVSGLRHLLNKAVSEEALKVRQIAPVFHVFIADRREDDVDAFDGRVTSLSAPLTAALPVLTTVAHLVRDRAEGQAVLLLLMLLHGHCSAIRLRAPRQGLHTGAMNVGADHFLVRLGLPRKEIRRGTSSVLGIRWGKSALHWVIEGRVDSHVMRILHSCFVVGGREFFGSLK